MLQQRLQQEFEAACLERGYHDENQRLGKRETIRLLQDVGYMTDPRRTDPTGASISVIEEPVFEDLWRYLTQNVHVPHFADENG